MNALLFDLASLFMDLLELIIREHHQLEHLFIRITPFLN